MKEIRNIRTRFLKRKAPFVVSFVLFALLVIVLWEGAQHLTAKAKAETREARLVLPNAAAQRKGILEAQRETNAKLGELLSLLRNGKIKVIVVDDKTSKKAGEKNSAVKQKKSKSK